MEYIFKSEKENINKDFNFTELNQEKKNIEKEIINIKTSQELSNQKNEEIIKWSIIVKEINHIDINTIMKR